MAALSRNMYRVGRGSKLLQPRSILQSREGFGAIFRKEADKSPLGLLCTYQIALNF